MRDEIVLFYTRRHKIVVLGKKLTYTALLAFFPIFSVTEVTYIAKPPPLCNFPVAAYRKQSPYGIVMFFTPPTLKKWWHLFVACSSSKSETAGENDPQGTVSCIPYYPIELHRHHSLKYNLKQLHTFDSGVDGNSPVLILYPSPCYIWGTYPCKTYKTHITVDRRLSSWAVAVNNVLVRHL